MIDIDLEPIIAEYAKARLSPTEAERTAIGKRYEQLQRFLPGRTFQSGSYARFTSTTPVNDLDVIYVLPDEVLKQVRTAQQAVDPGRLDIHQIVNSLAEQLHHCYGKSARIEAQPHSVGIFFGKDHEFSIDVVPAAPAGGEKFWVPEVAQKSVFARRQLYRTWQDQARAISPPGPHWIKSDPKGYIKQASELDASTMGKFRKSAKALKRWRWSRKRASDAFRLKSFHLELMVTRYFREHPNATCIEAIRGVVSGLDELITSPQFPDLADSRQFVDQYVATLSDGDRALLRQEFERAQFLWAEVERAKTRADVHRTLEVFLGLIAAAAPGPSTIVTNAPAGDREGEEEFLTTDYGIQFRPQYRVRIDATVSRDGFRPFQLLERAILAIGKLRSMEFRVVSCNVPAPYEVHWKVKNTGAEARRKGDLRGQIEPDRGRQRRTEYTRYWGNHYVECYVIKDGICVAADHIDVPIAPKE
jgi:hypothetical protein